MIIDNVSDAIISTDINFNIESWNKAAKKIYGWKADDVIGKQLQKVLKGSSPDYSLSEIHEELFKLGSWKGELKQKRKDNTDIYLHSSISIIKDDSGNVKGIVAINQDITKQKNTGRLLKDSEEKYRKTFNNLDIGFYRVSIDGTFISHNPTFNKIFGLNPHENLVGSKSFDFWQNLEDRKDYLNKLMNDGYVKNLVVNVKKRNGERIVIQVNSHLIKSENNEVVAIEGTFSDITERFSLEQKVKESEETLRNVFESIPMGMHLYKLDSNDRLIFQGANPQADKILNFDNSQFISKTIEEAFPPLVETDIPDRYRKAASEGIFSKWEQVAYDDEKIKGAYEVYAFQTSPGNMAASFMDITERLETERKLRESEKKYRQLVENAQEGIWTIDNNANTTFVNQRMAEMLGYSVDEMLGKHLFSFMDEEGKKLAEYNLERRKEGIIEQHDFEFLRKDRTKIYASVETSPIINRDGNFIGAVAFVADITERKQAEQKLREYQQMLQLVLDNIPQFIFWKDINSVYLGCNKNFASVAGVGSPANIVGKTDYDLAWKKSETEFFHEVDRLVIELNKPEYHIIEPQSQADGKQAWLDTNRIPLHDLNDNVVGILGTFEDITERKEAEELLKESEEKFRIITEQSFMGICIIQDNQIKYVNEAAANILEYSVEETLNWSKSYMSEKVIHPEDLHVLSEQRRKRRETDFNAKADISFRVITRTGNVKWIDQYSKIILYEGKNAELVSFMDITEIKEAERLIIKENKKLKELEKMRSDIITRVSHELKTPLTSTFIASQYLLTSFGDKMDDAVSNYVQIIHRGNIRLKVLIENLLDASRIESRKFAITKHKENLADLIDSCVDELKYLAHNRKLILNSNLPKTIYLAVDKIRIEQAITNIISNAIKNTPKNGEIFVSVDENSEYIDIQIKDTGVGLTTKEQKRLFERFGKIERYGMGLDVDIEGSGLGLYISKQIVDLHRGKILVESEGRNKGSTFIIRLFK